MTVDDLRAAWPDVGVALYAYEPRGPVTLELLFENGERATFSAASEAEALRRILGAPEEHNEEERDEYDDVFS